MFVKAEIVDMKMRKKKPRKKTTAVWHHREVSPKQIKAAVVEIMSNFYKGESKTLHNPTKKKFLLWNLSLFMYAVLSVWTPLLPCVWVYCCLEYCQSSPCFQRSRYSTASKLFGKGTEKRILPSLPNAPMSINRTPLCWHLSGTQYGSAFNCLPLGWCATVFAWEEQVKKHGRKLRWFVVVLSMLVLLRGFFLF